MSDAAHTWRSCSECNCPLLKGPESHEAPIEWLCPSCGGVQIEDSSSWSARQSARRQQIWSDLLRRAKDTKVAKGGATDAASSAPHPSRIPETTGPPISDDAYAEYELGRDHYDRWQQDGDSHNLAEALLHLRNAAGRGEELAYSDLGDLAFTQANTVEAMQWLRKAEAVGHTVAPLLDSVRQTTLELASQGRPDAQFEIAEWYLNGHGVAKDPKAAAAWLTKAAQQEFPAAMFTLSRLLDSGDGVNANTEMALTFLRRAAEAGSSDAQYELGCRHLDGGRGVATDRGEAIRWLDCAAMQGHRAALFHLATLRLEVDDFEKAVPLLERVAKTGHPEAQYLLSVRYRNGEGVSRDDEASLFWLCRAAERGNAWAECSLGQRYRDGDGVEVSAENAEHWLRLSALHGDDEAQLDLAYLLNDAGATDELQEAAFWFLHVAATGEPWCRSFGRYAFGFMCEYGRGVPKNTDLATKWYLLAVQEGHWSCPGSVDGH